MSILRRVSASLVLGGVVAIVGCDGPPSVDTGTVEANVTGVVKVDGVPVKEGELLFDATNYQRAGGNRTATIKDGNYSVKTLTGRNNVKISGKVAKGKPMLQTASKQVDVKSGDNTVDLEFSAK